MRVIVCENYEEMSVRAAEMVSAQVLLKPKSVLGLATGSTPIGMYENLVQRYRAGELDFSEVTTFNLDEYYPILRSNPNSYFTYMHEHLFDHVNLNPENCHILNGETNDPEGECAAFDKAIEASGGIDLQILGIGNNGHIGFNEPGSFLYTKTHKTDLTESTIQANSRFFGGGDQPTCALTMGLSGILKAKKIVLMASGDAKKNAIRQLMSDSVETNSPATMLNVHPDVTIICDRAAAGK